MKAIRENGLWVITAIVGGSVEEFAGKRLGDAIALLKRAQERSQSSDERRHRRRSAPEKTKRMAGCTRQP